MDGNKRAAFLAIGVFLAMNGRQLIAGQVDAIHTIFALAADELDEARLSQWIAKNSRRLESRR